MEHGDNTKSRRAQIVKPIEIKASPVACGLCLGSGDIEREDCIRPGWARAPEGVRWSDGMIALRNHGDSMEPRISQGSYSNAVGSRQDRIVLVEDRNQPAENRYSRKKYRSVKRYASDGTWQHDEIFLYSLNASHPPIRLDPEGQYHIVGWFVASVPTLSRVELPDFPKTMPASAPQLMRRNLRLRRIQFDRQRLLLLIHLEHLAERLILLRNHLDADLPLRQLRDLRNPILIRP